MKILNSTFIILLLLAVIGGAVIIQMSQTKTETPSPFAQQSISPAIAKPKGGFIYTQSGFTPKRIKFKSTTGVDIVFTNSSNSVIQISSDTKELNTDVITPSSSKTVTLTELGTYTFYEKFTPSQKATFEIIP